jgi:flagellar motility protein MotE (MotC chaperone)
MKRFVRELRIIPVVVFATGCLLALKLFGLALDGGYVLSNIDPQQETVRSVAPPEPAAAPNSSPHRPSWAQEMFGYPDTTGSVAAKPAEKPPEKEQTGPINPPKGVPDGKVVPLDSPRQLSEGERAVLERLQGRRQELDSRSREIEIREGLLKQMEKRLEARGAELKDIEGRIAGVAKQREEADAARLKNLVTMYEGMKAKEAARIFDRLDIKILIEVASQINARRMSDILAQMTPEAAERLTVELANRATGDKFGPSQDLPKIDGKPNGS